jgi:alpha-1,6-mannosyltransferase
VTIQDPVYAAEGSVASLPSRGLAFRVPIPAALSARLGLVGLLAGTLLVALAAARTPQLLPQTTRPAPSWLAGPFGETGLSLSGAGLVALLVAMFACYVLAVQGAQCLSARTLVLGILAVYALVLLAPPLFSTDLFSYQMYGRLGALNGLNPYLVGPHAAAADPLYGYVGFRWTHTPTVYGPLFTALSYGLAPLSIAASAFTYKGLAVVAVLLTLWLVWRIAQDRGADPRPAVALVGLNPLLFLYGAGGGHNDLLMLLPLVAGIGLALRRRPTAGGAMMVSAAAIKLVGGLPLLFALADGGRHGRAARRGMLWGAGVAAAGFGAFGAVLFGGGMLHLPTTLGQAQGQTGGRSVPALIAGGLGLSSARGAVALVLGVVGAAACAWLLTRVWRGRLEWVTAAGWAAAAVLLTTSWLVPWYVAWLLPLAGLAADRRLWRVSIALSALILAINLVDYLPHSGFPWSL